MVFAQFERKISKLRCDNGGEYSSNEFKKMCRESGIQLQPTVPYNSEQNGVAERLNRTLMEKSRSMIAEFGVDKTLWGEAVLTATDITNRSPTRALSVNKTPAEMWFNKRPNLSNFRVFGSTAYAHIPDVLRTKLDNKSKRMIMIGYANNGYRLWDAETSRVVICRDVTFDECRPVKNVNNVHEFIEVESSNIFDDLADWSDDDQTSSNESTRDDDEAENLAVPQVKHQDDSTQSNASSSRPQRERRQPDRFGDCINSSIIDRINDDSDGHMTAFALNAMAFVDDVARTFGEINGREDAVEWMEAVNAEMMSLTKNQTWTLVDPPPGRSIVGSKWVFSRKRDESGQPTSYKARLVARGFTQKPGLDFFETYSPVARIVTIRTLMAMAVERNFEMHQMDVCTAFLNGDLKEEIFMRQPEGFIKEGLVCKLNRSLYDLSKRHVCGTRSFTNSSLRLVSNSQSSTNAYTSEAKLMMSCIYCYM